MIHRKQPPPRIELAATRDEEVLLRRIRVLEALLRKIAEHSIDGWARAEARDVLGQGRAPTRVGDAT